jgi:uncharacterized membrane protein YqgA involved in biofilm formation
MAVGFHDLNHCTPNPNGGVERQVMKEFLSEFRHSMVADWPILAGAGAVWAALVLLLAAEGVDGLQPESYGSNLLLYLLTLILLGMICAGRMLYRARPASPIRFLIQLAAGPGWRGLVRGVPILAALVVFMPVFSAVKSSIPAFNAATWDATFIAADQALHGGDAWRLLQPVLGFPVITSALSMVYFAWFFVIYAGSIWFCFLCRDPELRARYFIAYFASWTVGGVILATGFASVGPAFAGPLLGDHRFDEQMEYLRSANEHFPVLTLRALDFLLAARLESSNGLGAGISAMPSMHVAMAVLVALSVAKISRPAAVAGYAFFASIMVGSVHLSPHYAVDGYASIAVTLVVWALAGRLAPMVVNRGRMREPAAGSQPGIAPA